jgi:biopolymer transport protein ExbD
MKLGVPVRRKHSRIEIIPLIDIMFFLLASFMMVSLSMDQTQNIKVNLPSASQARHDFSPTCLTSRWTRPAAVWFQKAQISLPQLSLLVSNRFRVDTNLPVYISGDRDTLHGAMADVYEVVRGAGVQKVAFAVAGQEIPGHPMKLRSPLRRRRTRLEIIPLIDIMFFLLASFMMVSLQMQKVRTLKASLPTATLATADRQARYGHPDRRSQRPSGGREQTGVLSRFADAADQSLQP